MGLKTTNYKINGAGITIPEAYAQIEHINVDINGSCYACFKIQTSRSSMDMKSLDNVHIYFEADKNLPIYEQAYNYAKQTEFVGWADDIVELPVEEIVEEENDVQE